MRHIISFISVFAVTIMMMGCNKESKPTIEYIYPTASDARLKINFASVYQRNPSVQIAVNNVRVSNLLTARTPFPGGGYNTGGDNRPDYLDVTPGSIPVAIAIPKYLTNTDSVNLFTGSVNLAAGKYYSLHIADTAANTKYLLVEDDVVNADTGSSKYRFINLMPDVPAVDFYFGTTLVAPNISYLSITPSIIIKNPTAATAWFIRPAGASVTTTAMATYSSSSTYISTRDYVVFAMGYKSITGTTDPRRPFVSFYHTR
jgi:hypothetical protein